MNLSKFWGDSGRQRGTEIFHSDLHSKHGKSVIMTQQRWSKPPFLNVVLIQSQLLLCDKYVSCYILLSAWTGWLGDNVC